jgi:hypothetical protein
MPKYVTKRDIKIEHLYPTHEGTHFTIKKGEEVFKSRKNWFKIEVGGYGFIPIRSEDVEEIKQPC